MAVLNSMGEAFSVISIFCRAILLADRCLAMSGIELAEMGVLVVRGEIGQMPGVLHLDVERMFAGSG